MKKEPIVLAIETAIGNGSLSLLEGETEIASSPGNSEPSRSEDLLETISGILQNNRLEPCDIDLISVSIGPGSFTGVRVGMAVAKALVFGLNCHGVGVSVMDAFAFGCGNSTGTNVIVVPAGRSQIFWRFFFPVESDGREEIPPRVGVFDDLLADIELTGLTDVSIVVEPQLLKGIRVPLNKIKQGIRVTPASDKISVLIGQTGYNFVKNKLGSGEPSDSFSEVQPQYALGLNVKLNVKM